MATAQPSLPIHVVSDVVCPWCFIGKRRLEKAIAQRVAMAAQAEGLTYAIDKISRQPNTTDCHRLILWAQQTTGDAANMKQRLMDLYFTEGADLTDRAVLIQAAVDCGLEKDVVAKLLDSDADVERISREVTEAKEAGIDGVPCFIFGGVLAVSGAQAPDYIAGAIRRAAEELANREQASAAE